MKAHKLLEALDSNDGILTAGWFENTEESGEYFGKVIKACRDFISDAHHFSIGYASLEGADVSILIDTARDFIRNNVFILPYPVTCLTLLSDGAPTAKNKNDQIVILATQEKMGHPITISHFSQTNGIWQVNIFGSLFHDGKISSSKFILEKRRDNIFQYETATINTLLASIILIQSKGIKIETVAPDSKLNKSRIKKGKPPLFEYKTIELSGFTSKKSLGTGNGTHASPRLHFRRGHVRTLPTGVKTAVQACVVGSRENGIISKNYTIGVK